MSLLLTKTCEYVLIIALEEGRYFETDTSYSIRVDAELDLKLPPTLEDLLPLKTNITTESSKIDNNGHCTFLSPPLAYFISHKQFRRLRKTDAMITLKLTQNNHDEPTPLSSLQLCIQQAQEVIKKSGQKIDLIYEFVSDKGAWMTLPKRKEQIKVGFYYVSMNDHLKNTHTHNAIVFRTPPPPTVQKRISNRKKVSSILGHFQTNATSNKQPKKEIRLKRAKSSIVDLNIEEIADILKKIKIFSAKEEEKIVAPYHQIGKGSSQFTFYFKVLDGDQIQSSLLRSSTTHRLTKQPHFGYSFLNTYNYIAASSLTTTTTMVRTCYPLRGHLVDIQHWLDSQQHIELSLIVVDAVSKITVGKCRIPLSGIAYHLPSQRRLFSERSYGIYNETEVGKVWVRIGLVSGWHTESDYDYLDDNSMHQSKRLYRNEIDPWDSVFQDKKMRHSQRTPTLTTSSTTTTTSTTPSIQLITPSKRKS